MSTRLHRLVALLLSSALLLAACNGGGSAPTDATPPPVVVDSAGVSAEGRVVPRDSVHLTFTIGGPVAEVLVHAGDAVVAGQTLVRLQADGQSAALAQAQGALAVAQAQRAKAQASARPEELLAAQAVLEQAQAQAEQAVAQRDGLVARPRTPQVALAEANLAQALAQLHYAESVHNAAMQSPYGGPIEWQAREQRDAAAAAVAAAQAQLDLLNAGASFYERRAATSGLNAAQAQVAQAQAQLDLLRAGTTAGHLAVLEASVAQAQAAVVAAQSAMALAELKAPFAGTVADVAVKAGEVVGPGRPVVTLADLSQWVVETDNLTEIEVVKLSAGQSAAITLDALPGVEMRGEVLSISSVFENKRGDITYTVKVALHDADPKVRWGMTAQVAFDR